MADELGFDETRPVALHAHVTWDIVDGWSLWVSSWDWRGPKAVDGPQTFGRMNLEELETVMDAVFNSRVGWGGPRY